MIYNLASSLQDFNKLTHLLQLTEHLASMNVLYINMFPVSL